MAASIWPTPPCSSRPRRWRSSSICRTATRRAPPGQRPRRIIKRLRSAVWRSKQCRIMLPFRCNKLHVCVGHRASASPLGADEHPFTGGQDAGEAQGSRGIPTAGSSTARFAFDSLYQIVHPAEDRARPVAHPEHLAAQVAFQKHRKGDRAPEGGLGFKAVAQPGISSREGSFRGSFLGKNASTMRSLQSPYHT